MTTREQVKSVISKALGVDLSAITDDLSIASIPEWDSVGNMAIISSLEEQMGVDIPLEDLFELTSVESIVNEMEKLKL